MTYRAASQQGVIKCFSPFGAGFDAAHLYLLSKTGTAQKAAFILPFNTVTVSCGNLHQ